MAKETPLLVPEILEAILLKLPIQDLLLTAQRVNHAWKTTIDSSIALQQALFFQPLHTSSSPQLSFNPLLQKAFPPWFRTTFGVWRGARFIDSLPWASSPEARAAFMRADACWRNMLPCQPARMVIEVVGKKNIQRGVFESNGRVRFDGGIRMGHLYDLGFEAVRKYVSSFWIQWDKAMEEEKVTMFTEHSWFHSGPRRPPDVGEEFRSEAYKELVISMREEGRSRRWHAGFGNPPHGGWHLR